MNIDETNHHVMRTNIRGEEYVTLGWPKNITVFDLQMAREMVNLQLDQFIKSARRKTERQEAADAEYESWVCTPKEPGHG